MKNYELAGSSTNSFDTNTKLKVVLVLKPLKFKLIL